MKYLFFLLILIPFNLKSQCSLQNSVFKVGEKLSYEVYYNWGFIWMNVGSAYFKVDTTTYNSKKVFSFYSYGSTYSNYDWLYKVRDTYKSIVDTKTLLPIKFSRDISEGGYNLKVSNIFDYENGFVYSSLKKQDKPLIKDTLKLDSCIFDVLSIIYYARNINFSEYNINAKIPISIILDNEIFNIYVRYLGIENIEDKQGKEYNCIKFKPLLVDGTIFKGGEDMSVWVTNDKNKIPILVQAEVVIGSVKIYFSKIEVSTIKKPLSVK